MVDQKSKRKLLPDLTPVQNGTQVDEWAELEELGVPVAWYTPESFDSTAFAFLRTQAFLAPLLVEGYPHIRACFPDAQLFLAVVADPETNDHEKLVISIAPTCSPSEALAAYQQLKQRWLLPALRAAQGKLAVLLEYR